MLVSEYLKDKMVLEKMGEDNFSFYITAHDRYRIVGFSAEGDNIVGKLYAFMSLEKAIEYGKKAISDKISVKRRKEELKKKRKEKAEEFKKQLRVGTILEASWGYEASWYDYYEVVGFAGSYVLLKKNKKTTSYDNISSYDSRGVVCPIRGEFESEEVLKRKINSGYVKIQDYSLAFLWDGREKEEACWH